MSKLIRKLIERLDLYVFDTETQSVIEQLRESKSSGRPPALTKKEAEQAVEKYGSVAKAAKALGLSREAIYKRLREQGSA